METIYKYRAKATSTVVRSGLVVAEEIQPSIAFNAPPEFQGQAGYWTPEHFLVAAVASCFVSTFSGMAANSKFEFLSLNVGAEGVLGKDQGGWRFQSIVLRPQLKIARAEDLERGNRLLVKAESNCLVGRSLACPLTMEPEVNFDSELVTI